jgi:hypothetical protein
MPHIGLQTPEFRLEIKNGTVLFIHRSVGNIFEPKQMKREGSDKIEPSRFLLSPIELKL